MIDVEAERAEVVAEMDLDAAERGPVHIAQGRREVNRRGHLDPVGGGGHPLPGEDLGHAAGDPGVLDAEHQLAGGFVVVGEHGLRQGHDFGDGAAVPARQLLRRVRHRRTGGLGNLRFEGRLGVLTCGDGQDQRCEQQPDGRSPRVHRLLRGSGGSLDAAGPQCSSGRHGCLVGDRRDCRQGQRTTGMSARARDPPDRPMSPD
jgi:hypothetical protein